MVPLPFRITKTRVFAALMLLSAAAVLLPPSWSDSLKHLAQMLVPAQDVAQGIGAEASRSLRRLDVARGGPQDADRPEPPAETLHNQLVFQNGLIEQLRSENAALRGLRERFVPPDVRLIPARVVGHDIATARDALLLSRGGFQGVRGQDWVVSRLFIDRGAEDGVEQDHTVLAQEYLIGRVELVSPYMARVRLFSDIDSRVAVRVGRFEGQRFVAVDYACTLRGRSGGRMVIEDVPVALIDEESSGERPRGAPVRVGDFVTSVAGQFGLPSTMVIGRVSAITQDARKRLVASIEVEPPIEANAIRSVFVVAHELPAGFTGEPVLR